MIETIYRILFLMDFVLVCMVVLIILNKNKKQETKKDGNKIDTLSLFHHIHHEGKKVIEHKVHHCGGDHVKIDSSLTYTITHCKCGKHKIDVKEALGHDPRSEEVIIVFEENCPEGGWQIESGKIKK